MPQEIVTPAVDARNCLNYSTDGGDKLVINGTLEVNGVLSINDDAEVSGISLDAATADTLGTIYQAAEQEASAATDVASLVADFNGLLEKLKAAGIMAETHAPI